MTISLDSSGTEWRPRILIDGREDDQGRALLVVSALYFSAARAMPFAFHYIDVRNPAVEAAVEVLRWDTGLNVSSALYGDSGPDILLGARLYVSVVFSER